jgi:chemotaxis signal transduction protein
VQVPEAIVHVPHSDSHVLGVMTLRSRLLPLVNLRSMFALEHRDLDEKSRIVVLTLNGVSVGVVVDAVSEVLRVSKSGVDALPALLAREGNLAEITSICRLDNGKRLVSIVTARNLFGHSVIKEALSAVSKSEEEGNLAAAEADDDMDDDEQVVIFRLDKEEFGAPIATVQEIVRVPEAIRQEAVLLSQGGTSLYWIVYSPEPECFFQGDAPFHRARQTPGLLWGSARQREPFPLLTELDTYRCILDFSLLTAAPHDELAKYFRYMPEQAPILEVDPQWLDSAPLLDEATAFSILVFTETMKLSGFFLKKKPPSIHS